MACIGQDVPSQQELYARRYSPKPIKGKLAPAVSRYMHPEYYARKRYLAKQAEQQRRLKAALAAEQEAAMLSDGPPSQAELLARRETYADVGAYQIPETNGNGYSVPGSLRYSEIEVPVSTPAIDPGLMVAGALGVGTFLFTRSILLSIAVPVGAAIIWNRMGPS